MSKKNTIKIELQQNWENISGVSEIARAKVEVLLQEKMTINSNGDRFDCKPQWLVLGKEDAVFLAKQIIAFYEDKK